MAALSKSTANKLLKAGSCAPSGGNVQPWIAIVEKDTITLSLDPKKVGTVLDVGNYGSILALGSFVQNMLLEASAINLIADDEIKYPNDNQKFAIEITFKNEAQRTHRLQKYIPLRHTNRQLSDGTIIEQSKIEILHRHLDKNTNLFTVSHTKKKSSVAKILGKADAIRTKHTKLLTEMMSEIRWNNSEASKSRDGIDIQTMELPGNISKMLKLLSAHPKLALSIPDLALERQAYPLLKQSSHLACLTTSSINPTQVYKAGKILQLLWLEATADSISIHPWTVLSFFIIRSKYYPKSEFTEKQDGQILILESKLKNIFGIPQKHTPLFIFRLSYSKPASRRSLRIPVNKFSQYA